jgi:hypothetical protein
LFDASLTGIGILIYEWSQASNTLRPIGGATIPITSLAFEGKPEYQNTAEILGAFFAVRIAHLCQCDLRFVWLAGDSVTALTWADKWAAHSPAATNVAIMYTLQAISLNLHVGCFAHIPGTEHWRCDSLSREGSWKAFCAADPSWAHIAPTVIPPSELAEALHLCNPATSWSEQPLIWQAAQAAMLKRNTTESI